jgi:hypothetical protein
MSGLDHVRVARGRSTLIQTSVANSIKTSGKGIVSSQHDAPLTLHHGTTLNAANAILRDGWQPMDIMDLFDRIAIEHELTRSEIVNDLKNRGRCRRILKSDPLAFREF